jgi:hypothetical protein
MCSFLALKKERGNEEALAKEKIGKDSRDIATGDKRNKGRPKNLPALPLPIFDFQDSR